MLKPYTYRGTYDESELGRITDVLDTQRDIFNKEDERQNSTANKTIKYVVIVLGIGILLMTLNSIKSWKTK